MKIGEKLKALRIKNGLTQKELADRAELSKGYISLMERDLTSPVLESLENILEILGTSLTDFFNSPKQEKIVYGKGDVFAKEDSENGVTINWLVTDAQDKQMEAILVELAPEGGTAEEKPHEGEEFGYVLKGGITLCIGEKRYPVRKGESFSFLPGENHRIINRHKGISVFLWISTPPTF